MIMVAVGFVVLAGACVFMYSHKKKASTKKQDPDLEDDDYEKDMEEDLYEEQMEEEDL